MVCQLNENIKRARLARGLNQVKFAKLLGVTKQCVSNWECDNVLPSIEMLIRIADTLGVTTDYLLGRDERCTLDVSFLTDSEAAHIALLVKDIAKARTQHKATD